MTVASDPQRSADKTLNRDESLAVEDWEFVVTQQDIRRFFARWRGVILKCFLLGLVVGAGFGILRRDSYSTSFQIERDQRGLSAMRDSPHINAALAQAFSQAKYSRVYADHFFQKLSEMAATSAESPAADTRRLFIDQFAEGDAKKGGQDAKILESATEGLATYLATSESTFLRDGRLLDHLPFVYLFNSDGAWFLTLTVIKKNLGVSVVDASIAALNASIDVINQDEEESRSSHLTRMTQRAKENFERTRESFGKSEASYEREKADLRVQFYALDFELHKLEQKTGGKEDGGPTESPWQNALGAFDAQVENGTILGQRTGIDVEGLPSIYMTKRLARLRKMGVVTEEALSVYLDRLSKIEVAMRVVRSKMDASQRATMAAQETFTRAVATSTSPLDPSEFAIPYIASDRIFLNSGQVTGLGTEHRNSNLARFLALGGLVGLIGSITAAAFVQVVHTVRDDVRPAVGSGKTLPV